MNDRQAAFVEEMGQYLASVGMTPMAGRMLAWLLICEPIEQTAADLAEALRASRGAVSGASRQLETAGFVRRSRRRGDRREYFSIPPDAIRKLLSGAGDIYHRMRVIASHGVGVVADLPPPARRRIEDFHDFVAFVERSFPALIQQYFEDRTQFLEERDRADAQALDGAEALAIPASA